MVSIIKKLRYGALGVSEKDATLVGARIIVRPYHFADYHDWAKVRGLSFRFLQRYEATWPKDALSAARFYHRVSIMQKEWWRDEAYSFVVTAREGGAILGGLSYFDVARGFAQKATLGYWMGQIYAGQGIMREAVSLIVPFAFQQLRLHRIEASCVPDNTPSRHLLQRVGFTEEGYAQKYLKINGEWQDHVLFGLTREAWAARGSSGIPDTPR